MLCDDAAAADADDDDADDAYDRDVRILQL